MKNNPYRRIVSFVLFAGFTCLLWAVGCKLKKVHQEKPYEPPAAQTINGREPYTSTRLQEGTGGSPEFLSVTVLPGRGMDIYQITAYIPGIGATNLLASPPIEEASATLTGKDLDASGNASTELGGAFLVPFTSRVHGTYSADKTHVTTMWNGHTISLPTGISPHSSEKGWLPTALHGLILTTPVDGQVEDVPLLDGHQLNATLHGFNGQWPSTSDVHFRLQLAPRAVDVIVTVNNTGNEAEPVSIAWMPHLAIPSGQRAQARLHIPATQRVDVQDDLNRVPTGRFLPVANTPFDFSGHNGKPLNNIDLDADYTSLTSTVFDSGPMVELIDPASNYGIRLTCRSPQIKSIHVHAPAGKNYVTIQPQFNYLDPFSKAWKPGENGMTVLQPGESLTYSVRLEFYAVASSTAGTF
jgi:aldose 1-epimerase